MVKLYVVLVMTFLSVSLCTADLISPAAPTGLTATKGINSVNLNWDDSLEGDLEGYNVYRSTTSGYGYVSIDAGLATSEFSTDYATAGNTYYYVVTAVDTSANESPYSNEVFAKKAEAPASGSAIIALSEGEVGLYLNGMPDLMLCADPNHIGGIYVNSTLNNAVDLNGDALDPEGSLISEINVVGGYEISDKIMNNLETINNGGPTPVRAGVPPIPDPYASLVAPSLTPISPSAPADGSTLTITTGTHVLQPGYYPGGLSISGGTVTLNPGIYRFGEASKNSGGLSITGGVITAEQVMLYIEDGKLDIRGNTQMTLSPPTSGDYKNISIFQSRDNLNDAEINGGGGLDLTGVLYFPNNQLAISGNSDRLGTQLITDTIYILGTGLINIAYDGINSYHPGDIDYSGMVDFSDLSSFSMQWLDNTFESYSESDINFDHVVDFWDFAFIAENWMN